MVKILHLNGIEGPAEMWKVLAARIDAANTSVSRMRLFRKLSTLPPIPGQPIVAYFPQLLEITSQVVDSAESISAVVLKSHIFTTVPAMYTVPTENLQSRTGVTIQVISKQRNCELIEAMATEPDSAPKAPYSKYETEAAIEYEDIIIEERSSTLTSGTPGATPVRISENCCRKDRDSTKRV